MLFFLSKLITYENLRTSIGVLVLLTTKKTWAQTQFKFIFLFKSYTIDTLENFSLNLFGTKYYSYLDNI